MRAILSTLLVSLVSLASLEQCQALDTPHGNERPQYYFPRRIKREIHRESPLYVKREVVVIPVTVMLGPDGKKTTLGANKVVGMGTQPTAVTSADNHFDRIHRHSGLPSLPPIPPVNDTISSLSMSLPTASLSIDPITTPGIPMSSQIFPPNNTSTVEPSGSATQIPGSVTTTSDLIPEFPTLIPPSVTEIPIGSGTGVRPRPTNTASNGEHSTPSGSATSATGSESQPTATPSATGTSTIPSGIFPPSGSGSGSGSGILRPTTTSGKGSATETGSQTMSITTSDMASPYASATQHEISRLLCQQILTQRCLFPQALLVQPDAKQTPRRQQKVKGQLNDPRSFHPPPNEDKTPPNSVVVNLGFNGSLSYDFVVDHSGATTQIFYFLPMGVAYALEIPNESVKVGALRPYDTVARLGYTTTVASVYIPSDLIQSLALQLRTPSSRLYNNPDPSVRTIMAMLDPTIPLTGVLSGGNGSPSNPGQNNPDQPGGDDGGNSQDTGPGPGGSGGNYNVRATSVGIGLGVVGGASLYGAAMFFVARRYRRRRRLMNEESFLTDGLGGPAGREGEPFMSGARSDGYGSSQRNSGGGTSARTQTISPPMMAENSLGWN
ncbi:hypothetical protein CIHG_09149 [Coccidioides immitis H538.4]|uniref:Uncharacterized protein n=1 Tax=Coccidioides immitis H538.4 TaxID=396776 RepID=A0A0J8S4W0_COCIT|nr:hypothetical protein CIHG_09149 [Coccidioides immitis H538.4]